MRRSKWVCGVLAAVAVGFLLWVLLRGSPAPAGDPPPRDPDTAGAPPDRETPPPVAPGPAPAAPRGGTSPVPAPPPAGRPDGTPDTAPDLPDGPAAPGEVVGVVLRLPGRAPVAGAVVELHGGSGLRGVPMPETVRVVTGSNGVFRQGGLGPGSFVFEVRLAGHGPRLLRVDIPPGEGVDGIEVLFGSGGAVMGRIDGPAGPLAGLCVRINRAGTSGGRGLSSAETDAGGNYRLEDLEPGDYSVEVDDGRSAAVTVAAGAAARLDFPAGASLQGVVTDADGSPLAGAIVRVRRDGGGYAAVQERTGKDGRYRIPSLPPGAVVVGIQVLGQQGYAADLAALTLVAGENRLDLDLRRSEWAGEISGRVFDAPTGAPLGRGKTQISLRLVEPARGEEGPRGADHAMAFADDSGEFRFRALRAGLFRLDIYSFAGHAAVSREIALSRGERRTGLEIGLEPVAARAPEPKEQAPSAATLSGTILDREGHPLAGAYVRAHHAAGGERLRQGRTDGRGAFRITGLDPGPWRVNVQVLGTGAFAAVVAEVEILPGENSVDVRLSEGQFSGEIRGRVFARGSGRPLSSRDVQVSLSSTGPDGKPRFEGTAFSDAEGGFRFPFVRPGSYRLRGWPTASGLAETEIGIVLAEGEVREGVELALPDLPTGRVRFTVKDDSGAAVEVVSIESLRDGKRMQGSMTSNSASGVYSTNFEAGPHDVTIRGRSGALAWTGRVEVRAGETTEVEAVLRPTDAGK